MQIPELTHLQTFILETVGADQVKGRDIRTRLEESGSPKSGPAFYQIMSRLEQAGFIEGHYEQRFIGDQIIKERTYKLTGPGRRALNEAHIYYAERAAAAAQVIGLAGALNHAHS